MESGVSITVIEANIVLANPPISPIKSVNVYGYLKYLTSLLVKYILVYNKILGSVESAKGL